MEFPLPEPLGEDEIAARVCAYRAEFESRWPSCRDYLAGVAWPAMQCRITNNANEFLNDVEVILTFHSARGVKFRKFSAFNLRRFWDPNNPLLDLQIAVPQPFSHPPIGHPFRPRHNDDGDLEVTITLPKLPPKTQWRSDERGEDIVLVVDPNPDIETVTVTYTATAQGHGEVFEGDPIAVPVEKIAMPGVLKTVIDANR